MLGTIESHTQILRHTHTHALKRTHRKVEYKHRMQPMRLQHLKAEHKGCTQRLDGRALEPGSSWPLREVHWQTNASTACWCVKQLIPPGARGHAGCTHTRSEDDPSCSSHAAWRTWTPSADGSEGTAGQVALAARLAFWFKHKEIYHIWLRLGTPTCSLKVCTESPSWS